VARPELANHIWEAKLQLPKEPKTVYIDPELTPLQISNKQQLARDEYFQRVRKAVVAAAANGKGKKGTWLLDEYVLRWEADGKWVKAFYHKAYPSGLLADGKPAPSYPGVAEAAAAGGGA
jgi:hypothetical protein